MTITAGDTVTVKAPERAYGYDGTYLLPGELAVVVNPKVPAVTGRRPYFAFCEFVKDGRQGRAGIFPDNLIKVK